MKAGWILAALLALPAVAPAVSITDPDKGGEYSLTLQALDADTYVATFTIDLDPVGLEIPATSINEVNFKLATSYTNVSVLSAPDATGNWSVESGPLSGSGCGGVNGDFICLDASSPLSIGSDTLFTWTVQFDTDTLLALEDWHLGARYTSPTKTRGWVVSLSGSTAIPEPASGILFGAGMLIVGASARRRLS